MKFVGGADLLFPLQPNTEPSLYDVCPFCAFTINPFAFESWKKFTCCVPIIESLDFEGSSFRPNGIVLTTVSTFKLDISTVSADS